MAAVQKKAETYEHIDPTLVGNAQRVLVSDLAGRSNLLAKAAEFGIDLSSDGTVVQELLREVKELESQGYAFEGADGSFELLMRKALEGARAQFFHLIGFRVIVEKRHPDEPSVAEAISRGPAAASAHRGAGERPVRLDQGRKRSRSGRELKEIHPRLQGARPRRPEGAAALVRVLIGPATPAALDHGRRVARAIRRRGARSSTAWTSSPARRPAVGRAAARRAPGRTTST